MESHKYNRGAEASTYDRLTMRQKSREFDLPLRLTSRPG